MMAILPTMLDNYDKVTRRDVITGRLGKDEMGGKRKKHILC